MAGSAAGGSGAGSGRLSKDSRRVRLIHARANSLRLSNRVRHFRQSEPPARQQCLRLRRTRSFSRHTPVIDRKSVVQGKSMSVRVDLGGRRSIKKKKTQNTIDNNMTHIN